MQLLRLIDMENRLEEATQPVVITGVIWRLSRKGAFHITAKRQNKEDWSGMLFISDSASSISCIRDIFYEIICWKVPGSQVFGDQNPVPRPGFSSSALTVEFIHCLLIGARTAHISSIKGTSSRVKFHAATPLLSFWSCADHLTDLQLCNACLILAVSLSAILLWRQIVYSYPPEMPRIAY